VSGPLRHRTRQRRTALRLAVVAGLGVATAALAAGLQVHAIRITGAVRFPASEVETALRFALGTPTVAISAETVRDAARTVPWVADARVSVSIDGVVSCAVTERRPAAIEIDGAARSMVDGDGHLLGPQRGDVPKLELHGFAGDTEGRAAVLAAAGGAESQWGARLVSAERLGPRDVLFSFTDTTCNVVADPARPESLSLARRVLVAWSSQLGSPPLRIDVRVPYRVAVTPAPPAPPDASQPPPVSGRRLPVPATVAEKA
jgi:cell division protein FtsQ